MTKQFKLYIDLENSAFEPSATHEIARILLTIAARLELLSTNDILYHQTIFDLNGNDVGRYVIKENQEP